MTMRKFIDLIEAHSNEHGYLLRYMKDQKFDPYENWWYVCKWLEDHDYLEDVSEIVGEPIEDMDELNEHEPNIFYKLPEDVQESCAEDVIQQLLSDDPAEAPSWSHMSLNKKQPLPNTTWLVHFSDNANEIWRNGFTRGVNQMDKLGLTTYLGDGEKKYGGYNFAFKALSRDALWAAHQGKYGKHAVLFQNSGVEVSHHGDEETQIIFWGASVNPCNIVLLNNSYGDWSVIPRVDLPNKDILFTGDYQKAASWVIQNHIQYKRYL